MSYLGVIIALLLLWPRGYMLAYLIDRSKSFSFGFKFFVGWLFGAAGFTLDVFGANVFGHVPLSPWIFYASTVTQIFGFGFMIFLFEWKVPYPHISHLLPFLRRHWQAFWQWPTAEKVMLAVIALTLVFRVGISLWQIVYTPTYDFDAWNNWDLRAKVIYTDKNISLDKTNPFYLAGGISSYPLNDSMLKVWLATTAGQFADQFINLASLWYYLILLAIFYFSLPIQFNRFFKLLAVYLLSSVPLLVFHSHVAYADVLYSIFLFISVASMCYYIGRAGNSFFYLSGIAMAFAIWTKNEGLSILFPLMAATTLILLVARLVRLKDFLLGWFFAALTIAPWLLFRFWYHLDFLSGNSSTVQMVFNKQFLPDMLSSIFLRSHFNLLWLYIFALIIFKFRSIWKDLPFRYLIITLLTLMLIDNGVILFTDKAYDLSALARVNLQLVPLGILVVMFSFHKYFAKLKS